MPFKCVWRCRMGPPKNWRPSQPTNLLSLSWGGHSPRREERQALTPCLLWKATPFCCLHLAVRSPHWQCPRGSQWQEAWGAFSELPLTFPSAFSMTVLVTDAVCLSPPRGHGESLPRCLSHSRYSHGCWHLVTASPWPDLIGLYMSLPK